MTNPIPSLTTRVYWEDTDASGIVYHANYIRWMERARSEWARSLGLNQEALLTESHRALVVANLTIAYKRPAHLDDTVTVRTRLIALKTASFVVEQTVWRNQTLLTTANVRLGYVDTLTGHPVAFSPDALTLFKSYLTSEDEQS